MTTINIPGGAYDEVFETLPGQPYRLGLYSATGNDAADMAATALQGESTASASIALFDMSSGEAIAWDAATADTVGNWTFVALTKWTRITISGTEGDAFNLSLVEIR